MKIEKPWKTIDGEKEIDGVRVIVRVKYRFGDDCIDFDDAFVALISGDKPGIMFGMYDYPRLFSGFDDELDRRLEEVKPKLEEQRKRFNDALSTARTSPQD